MSRITGECAQHLRDAHEQMWDEATVLASASPDETEAIEDAPE